MVQTYLTRPDLPPEPLTSREREVLQRIESHPIRTMNKLDIHETATLVRYAIRRGLTSP